MKAQGSTIPGPDFQEITPARKHVVLCYGLIANRLMLCYFQGIVDGIYKVIRVSLTRDTTLQIIFSL